MKIKIKSKEVIEGMLGDGGYYKDCFWSKDMYKHCGKELRASTSDVSHLYHAKETATMHGWQFHEDWYDLVDVDMVVSEQTHDSLKSIEDIVYTRLDAIKDELSSMTERRKELIAERKELNVVKGVL